MPISNCPNGTVERLAQAAAHLKHAMLLIEEVAPGILGDLHAVITARSSRSPMAPDHPVDPSGNGSVRPPIADRATFTANWGKRTCRLGNTAAFRLLERLACRPNQYIHCNTLLQDLWDCYTSPEAVRSAAKVLRRKLRAAGMEDLAEAIDGSTSHHYRLALAP